MQDFDTSGQLGKSEEEGCDLAMFTNIMGQVKDQAPWRAQADKEADYIDSNQLDSEALAAQEAKGIPPIVENLMGIQIKTAYGKAASQKKDAKVTVEQEGQGEELAEALNVKLNKAEKTSGADKACLMAHFKQIGIGIGWVEISRQSDPFKPPYRVQEIHRNEIWWDMSATEPDLSDAMWMLRRRWTNTVIAMQQFAKHADLIRNAGNGWQSYDYATELNDGGSETALYQARDIERGWSVEDSEWRDMERDRICLFEILTRHYCTILVLKLPDGRVIKFDPKNKVHLSAVSSGVKIEKAFVSEIFKTYYLGPHKLATEKLNGPDGKFNYVMFLNNKEDRTGIPYGDARGMMSLQDEHNARTSSMVWGLGAVRTIRTEGAVKMSDEDFRASIGRRDADIILDKKEMRNGGRFDVERDYPLTEQQYSRMQDIRSGIERQSLMSNAYRGGQGSTDTASGLKQEIEQSSQAKFGLTESFEYSRMQVLDHLLWMTIEDSQDEEEVFIPGGLIKDDKVVTINKPMIDEGSGIEYKDNDVSRIRMIVSLSDVPSNQSLAQQELMSLTEFAKSSMPEIQAVLAPHIANLSSIPHKKEIVEAIREIIKAPSEEQTLKRIEEAVDAAAVKAQHDLKERELDIKESKAVAEIENIVADAVNKSLEAFYSATQAAGQIVASPATAPIADALLHSAGAKDKDASPIIPNVIPGFESQAVPQEVVKNTSPQFPPRVQDPEITVDGIAAAPPMDSAAEGMNAGIEKSGVQTQM